jgi:hypothetical protein
MPYDLNIKLPLFLGNVLTTPFSAMKMEAEC